MTDSMTNVSARAQTYWEAVLVVRRILPPELRLDHVNGMLSFMAEMTPDPLIRPRIQRAVRDFRRALAGKP